MNAAPSYPAIRAPIDTLPNELLSDIFTMGAASPPSDYERSFPLLVSSISRRWREAAISSPPLWSQLFFTADPWSDSWCTDFFLPRSGAHPLDISINLLNRRGSADIVLKLLPYSERWRKLCIRVAGVYEHEILIIKPAIRLTSVPLLQHFELGFGGECDDPVDGLHGVHAAFFGPGAPALTSVKLSGMCLECTPPLFNLTTYRLDSQATTMSQSLMESIAAASPALRVLHLRLEMFGASGSGSINLPSLRELSLDFGRCRRINGTAHIRMLAIMLAPALKSLELVTLHNYEVRELNSLSRRFPNYPRPQTLKLSKVVCCPRLCDTLLGLFPTVTSLYLLDTAQEPTLSLLPALKHITYNHVAWRLPDDGCLEWLGSHVQDYRGTPRAMESVRIGSSMRGDHEGAHYRTLRDLVDLVELPDGSDSLQDSWSSDDEVEREDEYDRSDEEDDEEDDEDDLGDHWEDYVEDGNSDYELGFEYDLGGHWEGYMEHGNSDDGPGFENENAWGSDLWRSDF